MKSMPLNRPASIVPYLIISHLIVSHLIVSHLIISHLIITHLIVSHYFLLSFYLHIKLIVLISLVDIAGETVISTWHTSSYLHRTWRHVILSCLIVLYSHLLYFCLYLYFIFNYSLLSPLLLLWSFLFLFSFLFSFSFSLRRTSVGGILRTTSLHPLFPMRCGGVKRTRIFLPPLLPLPLDAANRHNSNSNQCSRKEFCAKFRDCRKVNIYSKCMKLEC